MIHNGFLFCDKCGKPIRLVSGMSYFIDPKNDYCYRCALTIDPPVTFTLRERFLRWFKGGWFKGG
jgi:hypothetical protein